MKFSPESVKVLKNFSTISTHMLLRAGTFQSTISPIKTVMAEAIITETIPSDFGIYDLTEFLGVLSMFSDADIEFNDKIATFKEGKSVLKYYASEPSLLKVQNKKFTFPPVLVDFTLTGAAITTALKTAGVLRSTDLTFEADGSDIYLTVADLKNVSANSFRMNVGATEHTFKANLKVENLKMLPGDYEVSIAKEGVTRWKNTTQELVYYVVLEKTSKF